MQFSNEEQQHLHRRIWGNSVKHLHNENLRFAMKVVGNVIGIVKLYDINREIAYRMEERFSEFEVSHSQDLQLAIKKNWVSVVENRGATFKGNQRSDDYSKILDLAKAIAKETAKQTLEDMAKTNVNIKEMMGSLVDQVKSAIDSKVMNITVSSKDNERFKLDEKAESIFIDVEAKVQPKKDVGVVKTQQSDISKSLEAMKRFKK